MFKAKESPCKKREIFKVNQQINITLRYHGQTETYHPKNSAKSSFFLLSVFEKNIGAFMQLSLKRKKIYLSKSLTKTKTSQIDRFTPLRWKKSENIFIGIFICHFFCFFLSLTWFLSCIHACSLILVCLFFLLVVGLLNACYMLDYFAWVDGWLTGLFCD